MSRPLFISEEDIHRWDESMKNEVGLPKEALSNSILKEVCYAGLWLAENLALLNCPEDLILRIQFTAGRLSFSRDPWEVSQEILRLYNENELIFEDDNSIKN